MLRESGSIAVPKHVTHGLEREDVSRNPEINFVLKESHFKNSVKREEYVIHVIDMPIGTLSNKTLYETEQ
jgi:hypothetical protein